MDLNGSYGFIDASAIRNHILSAEISARIRAVNISKTGGDLSRVSVRDIEEPASSLVSVAGLDGRNAEDRRVARLSDGGRLVGVPKNLLIEWP